MNVSFFRDMAFATRYAGPTRFLRTFFCKADAKTDCDTLWLVYVERVVAVVASLSILLSPHSSEALSPIETVKVVLHLIPPRSISFSAVAPLKTKGDEGNKRGRNGITGDDIVSNEDEENNNDDSTRANIQHLREMIHKEHENKLDAEDEQKLDDSPLVKSMRELGVGSPTTATATASASPGGGEEDAGEGQAQRERQSEVSTTTATDNDVDQDKFQIMALLLKTALDDIV